MNDAEIKKLCSNTIYKLTSKERNWHDEFSKAFRQDINDRISHWIDITRDQNLLTKESQRLLKQSIEAITKTTFKHLKELKDDTDNRNRQAEST